MLCLVSGFSRYLTLVGGLWEHFKTSLCTVATKPVRWKLVETNQYQRVGGGNLKPDGLESGGSKSTAVSCWDRDVPFMDSFYVLLIS